LLTGDILRIQIAIIAACAGTFVFAHTDLAQAGYPAGQEFIGSGSSDTGPGKECLSRMKDNEKAVVVADINNYQQQMLIRNIKKGNVQGNVKTTRKR
jgi:hypothetical protein